MESPSVLSISLTFRSEMLIQEADDLSEAVLREENRRKRMRTEEQPFSQRQRRDRLVPSFSNNIKNGEEDVYEDIYGV